LIARKLAVLFGINRGIPPFYAACCFDNVRRGSVLCLLNASFEKGLHNATMAIEMASESAAFFSVVDYLSCITVAK